MNQSARPGLALILSSLCGSAFAVAAMLYTEGQLARAELVLTPEREVAQETPRFVAAATVSPKVRAEQAQPATAQSPEATLVVPDFTGKRLSVARREAKALGLKLVARDGYGERVDPTLATYYKVRKQLTQVGARVSPGDTVQVRVREMPGVAMGY